MSFNNSTSCGTPPPLCQPCATALANSPCSQGCLDIYDTSCIQYDGVGLACMSVNPGDSLNSVLCAIETQLCTAQNDAGKVAVDGNDTAPDFLANKLIAGANIILTGIGSGSTEQLRIDAVIGGNIIDEKVKVSSTDQISGYLADKIVFGPCLFAQKLNPGINETYQISIDWNCALNQLILLPGFATAVNSVITPTSPMTCPTITLNSPIITGNTATFAWSSNGTTYNVFIDGVLQLGSPQVATTFTTPVLANGSHSVQVTATCNGGTPNTATQVFLINTVCPVPNSLTAGILSGTASLTWALDSNANNQNQTVQYKPHSSATWITAVVLPPLTNTYAITGLSQNRVYDFQIINNCSTGGPSPSTVQSTVEFTCPSLSLTSTGSSINYSFANLGGDVSSYVVNLFDSTGLILVQTQTQNQPFPSSINSVFNGLNPNTTYNIQVTVNAGTFSRTCGQQTISTTSAPSCPSPTNLNGTIS